MTATTTHNTSAIALPSWSRRTLAIVLTVVVIVAAAVTIVLTQFVGSSHSARSTTPGVASVQRLGVAAQGPADACTHGSAQLPRAC